MCTIFAIEMIRLAALIAIVVAPALALPAAPSAHTAYCVPTRNSHAEVIHMSVDLGCGVARQLALKTAGTSTGYYKSRGWYCRWGQGGTRPVRVNGRIYYGGFCYSARSRREATFLGRRL
jgi:hypothetical protein